MAKSDAVGNICHFNAVRYRVFGFGNLNSTMRSNFNATEFEMPSEEMTPQANREPVVLSDFKDQNMCLEFGTTEINEIFTISKVVIFMKPVASEYPQ